MKNTKIGILTFHKSINYGAFLQCYSLLKRIENDCPNLDVEVIDYCPKYEIEKYMPTLRNFVFGSKFNSQSIKNIFKNIAKLFLMPGILQKKKCQYKAFQQSYQYLRLSKKHWISNDYRKFWSEIKSDYDIIIVGSDAIWECLVFDFPNAYFLPPELNIHKMSYAACSGRMFAELLNEDEKEVMRSSWNAFDYVGVRDVSTEKFIHEILPECKTYHNCDPTLFLDITTKPFSKKSVEEKLIKAGISMKKPIIGIMGGDKMGKMVRSFFGKTYQIVAVYCPNRYADAFLADLTPFEWAISFSFFKITFTRYFHGTIFSLKNGTPTISIDDWKVKDGQTSKLFDILNRLDLLNHYFKQEEMYSDSGLNHIKETAIGFLHQFDIKQLNSAFDSEVCSFQGFKEKLMELSKNA